MLLPLFSLRSLDLDLIRVLLCTSWDLQAHQFPASGNHRDHHPVSSGFPAHGSQPMPSSPPPVIFPTHSVRQQPVMQVRLTWGYAFTWFCAGM